MPVKKSSKNKAFSWILAIVVVSAAAIGVGWFIGKQVLKLMNPDDFQQSVQTSDIGNAKDALTTLPSNSTNKSDTSDSSNANNSNINSSNMNNNNTNSNNTNGSNTSSSNVNSGNANSSTTSNSATNNGVGDGASKQTDNVSTASSATMYKVRVGSFNSRQEALDFSKELEAQGFPVMVLSSPPYSIQVGAFSSRENAVNLSNSLKQKGYASMVVE